MSSGNWRVYSQSCSPVRASTAMTRSSGVVMNMMPSLTTGGDSWPDVTPVDSSHTGSRSATFPVVIWSRGL